MPRTSASISSFVLYNPKDARAVAGTPKRCIEVLSKIQDTMGASEFVGVFKYGGMPYEEAERSLKLFAAEVMPAMKAGARADSQSAAAGS